MCLLYVLGGESAASPTWVDPACELHSLVYKYTVLKKEKH